MLPKPLHLESGTIGNTHTVIQRTTGLNPFGPSDTGSVSIAMIGSHLLSSHPVDTAPFGLGQGTADLHAVINHGGVFAGLPDTTGRVEPSEGIMSIMHSHVNGGTFDINMSVNPLLIFTVVGGDISNLAGPDVLLCVDGTGLLNPVGSIGGKWSRTPTPTRPLVEDLFPAGDFYTAADPASGTPVTINLTAGGPVDAAQSITAATVPTLLALTITRNGSDFDLEWPSRAGMLYNLWSSPDVTPPVSAWNLVEGDIVATPDINTKTVSRVGQTRFYVVEEFAPPSPLLNEHFEDGDGGWTSTVENEAAPWTWSATGGVESTGGWTVPGTANGNANTHARLTSPVVTVPADGLVTLNFDHRYSPSKESGTGVE